MQNFNQYARYVRCSMRLAAIVAGLQLGCGAEDASTNQDLSGNGGSGADGGSAGACGGCSGAGGISSGGSSSGGAVGSACVETTQGKIYYASPSGDDANAGTEAAPWKSIAKANTLAPGDTLRLLSGTYPGQIDLEVDGTPDLAVTIESADPKSPAVIDGGGSDPQALAAAHSDDSGADWGLPCVRFSDASFVELKDISYRNCWRSVVIVKDSSYVSIRGGDVVGGEVVVNPIGNAHHVLIEGIRWTGDERAWTTWAWGAMHHPDVDYFDSMWQSPAAGQSIYASNSISPGGAVIRDCAIKYVFNAISVSNATFGMESNLEVYRNDFKYVRDNTLEPGGDGSMKNWHFYQNTLYQGGHEIFSVDWNREGGPAYFYGNVVSFNPNDLATGGTKYFGSGLLWKFVAPNVNPPDLVLGEPLYIVNNTFLVTHFTTSKRIQAHLRHYNNLFYSPVGEFSWSMNSFGHPNAVDNLLDNDAWYPGDASPYYPEANGIHGKDPGLVDVIAGDVHLAATSPLRDAGRVVDGFTGERYQGSAPDIGAFEGDVRADGPPFVALDPPYVEHPRISRHYTNGTSLTLHFSWPLQASSVEKTRFVIRQCGVEVPLQSVDIVDATTIRITAATSLVDDATLRVDVSPDVLGENGAAVTNWASTVGARYRKP